ncbi:unnamed protein product [Effrenium voratum]|uniref:HTH-like domain-containing protein n=1 Tax=Effrenium voratum TaxID=2562239 RepID=A0AA36NLH1_9DINO|nr:unnamed protein product [Effrenium voratum]
MGLSADSDITVKLKELLEQTPELGYRAVHAQLAEQGFKDVGLKKVQKLMRDLREEGFAGYKAQSDEAPLSDCKESNEDTEVSVCRSDVSQKFGMMIDTETSFGGHRISDIREGGIIHEWNKNNPETAIQVNDILLSVNDTCTFDQMMEEFKTQLSCRLRLRHAGDLKEDDSEAKKEAAEWERRRARVTAALVPGLKKIIDSEFGPGAGDKIGRVEKMYHRVGRNDVFQEELPSGRRLAPGYIEDLAPVTPFHDVQDHPWCAELQKHWKSIKQELRKNLDESLWTAGAYQASNEAYGKDWKIMGVLTEDKWQDERRFKVTTGL